MIMLSKAAIISRRMALMSRIRLSRKGRSSSWASLVTASNTANEDGYSYYGRHGILCLVALGAGACAAASTTPTATFSYSDAEVLHAPSHTASNININSKTKNPDKKFRLKEIYDIEQVLGEGAYGMVFQARRKKDGQVVALKTMPRESTGKTDFEREVAALQLLSQAGPHDHVVQLYDLHRDDKNYYLAMELVQGGELFDHLIENGPYSEAMAAKFVRQFAEALCFCHSSGYTHADLKPENLMLGKSSSVRNNDKTHPGSPPDLAIKVVDFGSATTHDLYRKDLHLPAQEFAIGCSFVHQVALGNQFELQRILFDRPNLVNFRDYDKRTPLHIAAAEGHLDICRFLVSRGAQINRVDRWGGSPLDDAHRHGHTHVMEFLGQNGATFGKAAQAIEHFISAASQGDVEEVKALLKFGDRTIDFINEGDYDKRTALHLAAGEGRLSIVKMLCEAGANVNVEDRWGSRPLADAKKAKKNSDAMVKILEEYGATLSGPSKQTKHNMTNGVSPTGSPGNAQEQNEELEKVSGTVAYWPPEMFQKGASPTPATDMWAAGVILYVLLTGSHPFDKFADKSDEELADIVIRIGQTSKAKDGEEDDQESNLMEKLVFDERTQGLSESCVDLMRQLMHPDAKKRMTSDNFRRHPWVQGLTASWKTMNRTHEELQGYWQNRFRAEILKKFASSLGISGADGSSGEALAESDLQTIFKALDLKQNGVIELEELTTVFRGLGVPDKNIHQIFACADLDGSGVIRWDEFRTLMTRKAMREKDNDGDAGDGASDTSGGPGLQIMYLQNRFRSHILNRFAGKDNKTSGTLESARLREIFNAIDLEGNGVLDPHEIRVVLRSVGESEDVISRIVASLDVNQDGGVDWDEFCKVMGAKNDAPTMQ